MAYITTSWGRPLQGVSQQPDRVRLEGQCTLQENFSPDVVRGLVRRPATNHIRIMRTAIPSFDSKWHSYDRGSEQYIMLVEPSSQTVEVYNLLGERQTVTGTSTYLSVAEPDKNLSFQTVGDYTFICNRTTPVTMDPTLSPPVKQEGIVYMQFATYGRTYSIVLNGVVEATYTTRDGSESKNSLAVQTGYIAEILYTQLAGGTVTGIGGDSDMTYPAKTDWYAELHNNCIYIRRADNSDFTMSTVDSQQGDDLVAIKGSVKDVTSLPPWAPDGYVVRVTGEGKSSKDDYWLEATYPSTETTIRWVETVAPSSLTSYNLGTMPHVLVRESITGGVATFNLRQGEWEPRGVGSDDNNPLPSFIDQDNPQVIQSIGLFQNRLFFLSGENFVASRSNYFFNFYRESVTTPADTDPLDGYADTDKVSTLRTFQTIDGDMILFADGGVQYSISGKEPVTKANLTLRLITSYPSNTYVKPQAGGENLFFATEQSGFTGVREMFTDNYLDTKKAQPITDYVNTYIRGNCEIMLAASNFNTMFIRTDVDRNIVYTYDWIWQGEQKVQSAWGQYIFGGNIHYMAYFSDYLYLCKQSFDGVYLERINMFNDPIDTPMSFSVRLDRKSHIQATYNTSLGTWSWTPPYTVSPDIEPVFVLSTGGYSQDIGSEVRYSRSGNTFTSIEKLSDGGDVTLVCGEAYKSKWIPTQPVVKDARDRVIGLSSIIISEIYLNYEDAGHITAVVTDKYGRVYTYVFDGRTLGQSANRVGYAEMSNGQYRFPVGNRAEDVIYAIESSHHTPLTVRDMEMSGTFHQRGQRI